MLTELILKQIYRNYTPNYTKLHPTTTKYTPNYTKLHTQLHPTTPNFTKLYPTAPNYITLSQVPCLSKPVLYYHHVHFVLCCVHCVVCSTSSNTRCGLTEIWLLVRMLYIAMVPLYIPTARKLGLCLEKSRDVIPELVLYTRSGYSGFLMDQQHAIPKWWSLSSATNSCEAQFNLLKIVENSSFPTLKS